MRNALRVLILEDSEADARLMVRELERHGFEVEPIRVERREEFATALSPRLDLVLADYNLPQFDGSEALGLLKAGGLDVPFILVTGTLNQEQAVGIMMQGAFAAVLKDRLSGLGHIVVRALEERDAHRENRRMHESLAQELSFRKTVEDSMIAGLLAFDMEGRIVRANAAACRLLGYSREELIAMRSPFPFWEPGMAKEMDVKFRESLMSGNPIHGLQSACKRMDGTSVLLSVEASALTESDGKLAGQVALLHDITEQDKLDRSLRESESRFRTLVENLPVKVFIKDRTFKYVICNGSYAADLKICPEEIVGRSDYDFHTRDLADKYRGDDALVMSSGEAKEREESYVKDGREFWAQTIKTPLRNDKGEVWGVLGVFWDITERIEAEKNLRRQARTLRLLSRGNEALVRAKSEKELLDELCRIFMDQGGYATVWVGMREDDAARSVRIVAQAGEDRGYIENLRITWADAERGRGPTGTAIREGRTVICRDIATEPGMAPWREQALKRGYRTSAALPLRQNGNTFGALMLYAAEPDAFSDQEMSLLTELAADLAYGIVTLRARATREREQQEMRDLGERHRLVLETSRDLIALMDAQHRIVYMSPSVKELLGYDVGELVGTDGFSLIAESQSRQLHELFDRSIETGSERAEFGVKTKAGETRTFEISATWARDASGKPQTVLVIGRDVTERKRLQNAVQHAQKMESVGRLAGGVAHDFNNLLMVILANCDFLLPSLPEGDPKRTDIADIKAAAQRASELTRQLLIFSRKQVTHPEIFDLNESVRGLEKMLKRLIGEDIVVDAQLCAETASVLADPGQLEQVITNLAVNARDAMPKGGRLGLRTQIVGQGTVECTGAECKRRCTGECVKLEVSDTGTGMTPEVQEHLFEPFFTTKPVGKGTGLGLSTVYGIVRQADGEIRCRSEIGKGTTFSILFAREAGKKTVDAREPPATAKPGERILLVEDEESVRRIATRILGACGYDVVEAAGSEQALTILRSGQRFDLVLSDVVMPGMGGLELTKAARGLRPDLKILLMSGYPEREELGAVAELDGELLQKPFSRETMARKVREAIDGKSGGRLKEAQS